ncbi:hypothetical protein [Pseudomonas petrae]|uniref:hypothetical protein n=1 Tax=Pseudomonas petrae TaxID=2912190 RepID=UPI001F385651|nr:hypothetical protein [Pseudomonas petrae]MCF7536202.1 hypothetical protein [Pseudomonas petrae]
MISLEAQSAIINAQTEEFLRLGGHISSSPPAKPVPRPYGRQTPIDPSTKLVRSTQKVRRGRALRTHSTELIDQIEEMAKTMSCPEVAKALNMTYDQVQYIGTRHAIDFQKAENAGQKNISRAEISEESDLRDVERIKACIEIRVSIRQALKHLGFSSTKFYRLLKTYQVEYPLMARKVGKWPE